MSSELHIEDAVDHIVSVLVADLRRQNGAPPSGQAIAFAMPTRQRGFDLWLPDIIASYWMGKRRVNLHQDVANTEPYAKPFYDAAWYLCRIGVLRPGLAAPFGHATGPGFHGDAYSLTDFGSSWITSVADRPPSDPSRFGQVLHPFAAKFGPGFRQRAAEASRCYQTTNYLACCVMAGAAAESILLAIAIAKVGDEGKVLAEYRQSHGRKKITDRIVGAIGRGLAEQFTTSSGILTYWRDEAAHGTSSTITEVEAYVALAQLLRFAQLATDNWSVLTA